MATDVKKLAVGMAALWFYKDADKVLTEAQAAADQKEIEVDQGSVFVEALAMGGAVADDGGSQTDETTEANDATEDDMTLLPAAPEVNDAYYFGHLTKKFQTLRLNIGVQGDGVWDITWEYWNGTAWTALTNIVDGTTHFRAAAGNHDVTFDLPADWATTTVKLITAYWIRANVSAYTSIVTAPKGDQSWIIGTDKKLMITDFTNYEKGLTIVSIEVGVPAGSDTITLLANLANTYALGSTVYDELDLGSIKAVAIEEAVTFLQHYGRRTGIKTLDKEAAVQKELRLPFTWEEVKVANMNWWMYGGTATLGVFSVLTNPIRLGVAILEFNPTMQEKPYTKVVWLIPACHIKASGNFGYNDADWIGADGLLEVLYHATYLYGEMTVSTES